MLESFDNSDNDVFALFSCKFCAGCSLKYDREENLAFIRGIPYRKCKTYRKLAGALAVPKSTLFWIAKDY